MSERMSQWRMPGQPKGGSAALSAAQLIAQRMKRAAAEADRSRSEPPREYPRVTSSRGYWLKQREYNRLVDEEMPANVRRITYAKGFGDLSENAEYQYAKDEQRALLQRQQQLQDELASVRTSDFANAATDEVMPGVTVVVAARDGEKTYTVLGEWDNDVALGIISQRTLVARNMLGKKVGDTFELPDEDGTPTEAVIREIRPLDAAVRAWMEVPAETEI